MRHYYKKFTLTRIQKNELLARIIDAVLDKLKDVKSVGAVLSDIFKDVCKVWKNILSPKMEKSTFHYNSVNYRSIRITIAARIPCETTLILTQSFIYTTDIQRPTPIYS